MARQLDDAQVAAVVEAGKSQRAAAKALLEGGIEAVVAVKFFCCSGSTIDRRSLGIGRKLNRLGLTDERAGKMADEQCGRAWRGLFVVGVAQAEGVACIL